MQTKKIKVIQIHLLNVLLKYIPLNKISINGCMNDNFELNLSISIKITIL